MKKSALVPAWKRCWWADCEEETPPDDVFCVAHREESDSEQGD